MEEAQESDDLEASFGPVLDGTDPSEVRTMTLDGVPIGLVLRYAECRACAVAVHHDNRRPRRAFEWVDFRRS